METPSSMSRTTTRSQASAAATQKKSKQEGPNASAERSALVDITNDSPIVGLAAAGHPEKTPSSVAATKSRAVPAKKAGTPGSGEALLRGQVRTLLQKVEEDEQGETVDRQPFRVLLNLPGPSPVQLLAPTPANTPQIAGLSALRGDDGVVVAMDAVVEDCVKVDTPQAGLEEPLDAPPLPECQINRALLFDSPGKSEASTVSSYQESEVICSEKSPDDGSSSAWSLQVNMSGDHDDVEVEEGSEFEEEEGEEEEEYEEDEESFDDLCEGLGKMSMSNGVVGLPEFMGKHTRFVYSKDDEVIEEEEVVKERVSPSAVLLKGLPVPKGKHVRFHEEEEEEEEEGEE